ncbi:MAG: hypothetical protein CM1200mP25_4700 [Acidobacteriota bacterium]|nr:MAG: hypothetical protein CM1200mP25_4700 [Acidobacteriota bacterium]
MLRPGMLVSENKTRAYLAVEVTEKSVESRQVIETVNE